MNETLPDWVQWLQALAVPAIALGGLVIALGNFALAKKRRADELFDRRYELFREASLYRTKLSRVDSSEQLLREWDELHTRGLLLFGKSFANQLGNILNEPADEYESAEVHSGLIALFRKAMS